MLSYRHGFHAGNHADVLKHYVLVELLEYLNNKDTAYSYIDTMLAQVCIHSTPVMRLKMPSTKLASLHCGVRRCACSFAVPFGHHS